MTARRVWYRIVYFLVVAFSSAITVYADTFNWTGTGTSPNWDNQIGVLYANWVTAALPTAASDVNFGFLLASGNPNLNGSRIVNSVSVAASGSFSLTGNPGDVLTLASGNFTQLAGAAASGTHTVTVPVAIQTDGTWNIAGGGVTFQGGVTSSFGGNDYSLQKTGAGPLTLSGGASSVSSLGVTSGGMLLDGGSLNLTGSAESRVGNGTAAASLTVQDGAALKATNQGFIDISGTATIPATMTVMGASTTWQTGGRISVGAVGFGQLTVENGATVSGVNLLAVGDGTGAGTFLVQGGGTVSAMSGALGGSPNAAAAATVTGSGSRWDTRATLSVGAPIGSSLATGTLNVADRGLVTAGEILLYDDATINVSGGRVVTGSLQSAGTGALIDLVGDSVDGPALTVNATSGNVTFAGTISGLGTLYKTGGSTLTLGGENTLAGVTTIAGGQIAIGNPLALQDSIVDLETDNGLRFNGLGSITLGALTGIGDQDFGTTSVVINGTSTNVVYAGNMTGTGTLINVGPQKQILTGTDDFMALTNIDQGTIEVDGKLTGVGVIVNSTGVLAGGGQILANVLVNSGAAVAPGSSISLSPQLLTVESAYFEAGSQLTIVLKGTTRSSQYTALVATGKVILAGTLAVSTSDFSPAIGQSFDVLDWGALSGKFDSFVMPALGQNLMWNYSRLYTDGVISVTIAGDFDGNGVVDAADYVVWRSTDGTLAGYNFWRAHFGQSINGNAASLHGGGPVPETETIYLVVITSAVLLPRPRRPTSQNRV